MIMDGCWSCGQKRLQQAKSQILVHGSGRVLAGMAKKTQHRQEGLIRGGMEWCD